MLSNAEITWLQEHLKDQIKRRRNSLAQGYAPWINVEKRKRDKRTEIEVMQIIIKNLESIRT